MTICYVAPIHEAPIPKASAVELLAILRLAP